MSDSISFSTIDQMLKILCRPFVIQLNNTFVDTTLDSCGNMSTLIQAGHVARGQLNAEVTVQHGYSGRTRMGNALTGLAAITVCCLKGYTLVTGFAVLTVGRNVNGERLATNYHGAAYIQPADKMLLDGTVLTGVSNLAIQSPAGIVRLEPGSPQLQVIIGNFQGNAPAASTRLNCAFNKAAILAYVENTLGKLLQFAGVVERVKILAAYLLMIGAFLQGRGSAVFGGQPAASNFFPLFLEGELEPGFADSIFMNNGGIELPMDFIRNGHVEMMFHQLMALEFLEMGVRDSIVVTTFIGDSGSTWCGMASIIIQALSTPLVLPVFSPFWMQGIEDGDLSHVSGRSTAAGWVFTLSFEDHGIKEWKAYVRIVTTLVGLFPGCNVMQGGFPVAASLTVPVTPNTSCVTFPASFGHYPRIWYSDFLTSGGFTIITCPSTSPLGCARSRKIITELISKVMRTIAGSPGASKGSIRSDETVKVKKEKKIEFKDGKVKKEKFKKDETSVTESASENAKNE